MQTPTTRIIRKTPSSKRSLFLGLLIGCTLLAPSLLTAQTVPQQWEAQWISAPDGPIRDYDVLYFRKPLSLPSLPAHYLVDISADNRYELHINGKRVSAGPALADVHHWRYETVDLAPYLRAGDNQIAAIVWNFGTFAPVSQMTSRTAFLLSAEDPKNAVINTGSDSDKPPAPDAWLVSREKGRTLPPPESRGFYYAAGAPEMIDGSKVQWDWDAPTVANAADWHPARNIGRAAPEGAQDSPTPWILHKDELPPMQYAAVSAGHIVRVSGDPSGGLNHKPLDKLLDKPLIIPANADVTLLLDRDVLTTAFPSLSVRGGHDAALHLSYSEAMYDDKGEKGNRNEIAGRHIQGVEDTILTDGAEHTYRTLWWRTWRYLQVEVKTAGEPLTIDHLSAFYTAYPFKAQARFESSDPELSRIWDTGWRTAQLCSHETYMDTPYWEQLQYIGDTRIQALISYAVTGDDRLGREAMLAYRDSLLTNGLTQSRYPSSLTQVIPPFSLLWIGMLHDYWMYRPETTTDASTLTTTPASSINAPTAPFVKSLVPGTRGVIDWFAAHQRADGLLSRIEWWPFVDWSEPTFPGGSPPQDADGGSSALTLQFIEALKNASELEAAMGETDRANLYLTLAKRANEGLMRLNWDEKAGLLADTPAKKTYSQQANSLAVLLDVIPPAQQHAVMEKVLASQLPNPPVAMAPASYYFRFYLARAMVHAGLGDEYIAQLDPWRRMLKMGLSTWAEQPEPTRSDSHAWSAHPTLDLLTIVAGIAPGAPGFATVRITPHLGSLQHASVTMPTPKGLVDVQYERQGKGFKATVTLPEGLPGELAWHDQTMKLHAGKQELRLP